MDTIKQLTCSRWPSSYQLSLVRCLLVSFGLELASTAAANTGPQRVLPRLSVCDAIERSTALDGHEVSIRGRWVSNVEHVGIYPYKCRSKSPAADDKLLAVRLTSQGTNASLENAVETLRRIQRTRTGSYIIVATFTGALKRAAPGGSGHLRQYSVDLIVREIRDIKVLPGKRLGSR